MEQSDLLRQLIAVLEALQVRYLVTGSMASIFFGEARFTNDIDVVVELLPEHVQPLCEAFAEPRYYCSVQAAAEAVRRHFQFNILELDTGLKVDVIVLGKPRKTLSSPS